LKRQLSPVGQVASVEAVGPFPQIARQVLGADPVMSADEPGFDVAEQGMDDREEGAGIGARVLDDRRVLQMLAEIGVVAVIAGKPVGQQMGLGCDIRLEKATQFSARRGRQHGDAGVAGKKAVLTLDGMPVLSLAVLRRRHLLDGGNDQALIGVLRAAAGTGGIATAADEGLVGFEKAVQRAGRVLAQPSRSLCAIVQAVW